VPPPQVAEHLLNEPYFHLPSTAVVHLPVLHAPDDAGLAAVQSVAVAVAPVEALYVTERVCKPELHVCVQALQAPDTHAYVTAVGRRGAALSSGTSSLFSALFHGELPEKAVSGANQHRATVHAAATSAWYRVAAVPVSELAAERQVRQQQLRTRMR
jgi:hypothetical protein